MISVVTAEYAFQYNGSGYIWSMVALAFGVFIMSALSNFRIMLSIYGGIDSYGFNERLWNKTSRAARNRRVRNLFEKIGNIGIKYYPA